MKKVTAIVLAAAMGLSLTACGSSANQAGDNGSGGAVGTTQTALEAYSEQNQGITFDSQFSDWGDYWNKLATASAGHNLPDLVQMDYKYIKQYADYGMLVGLNP